MKAIYYVLVLALIFFRGIVIEAAKKSRPKGDITKDQIQSPTPGSNNVREYTVEHTPELGEEPSQKKNRRQGNSKRKSTAMSHLNEFKIEAARSKNALSKRAYRMQIIYANYSLTQSICMLTCSSSTFSGEGMTPDEIEAARVRNTASKSASRKHKHFVDLLFSIHDDMLLSSGESLTPDEIEAARVKNTASKSASRKHFVDLLFSLI
jgi:hypothetical protein